MASTLLLIKSKKLLPRQESEDEELTEEELIERIIEYKKYKEITAKFSEMYVDNKRIFNNVAEKIELPNLELDEEEHKANDMAEIYKHIIEINSVKLNKNAKNIEKIAITENYNVGDTVKTMFRELIRKSKFVFNKLFTLKQCQPQEVVTAFSGLLEMSRRNKVETVQEELFGDIIVTKKRRK